MAFEGSQGHATALASHSRGMPRLARMPTPCCHYFSSNAHVKALLLAPKGMLACLRKHAMALAIACLGLGSIPMGCMPWPWLPAYGGCFGLGCCMPWAWQHAYGGLHALGRQWASQEHAYLHAAQHRLTSSCTSKIGSCLFPFLVPKFIP